MTRVKFGDLSSNQGHSCTLKRILITINSNLHIPLGIVQKDKQLVPFYPDMDVTTHAAESRNKQSLQPFPSVSMPQRIFKLDHNS